MTLVESSENCPLEALVARSAFQNRLSQTPPFLDVRANVSTSTLAPPLFFSLLFTQGPPLPRHVRFRVAEQVFKDEVLVPPPVRHALQQVFVCPQISFTDASGP